MNIQEKTEILSVLANPENANNAALSGKAVEIDSFSGHIFSHRVNFSGAIFKETINFSDTVFLESANFSGAVFERGANFSNAVFKGNANFLGCRFGGLAYFWRARFLGDANFLNAIIYPRSETGGHALLEDGEANFSFARFNNEALFTKARFLGPAYFFRTLFFSKCYFDECVFRRKAVFDGTRSKVQLALSDFNSPPLLKEMLDSSILYPDSEAFKFIEDKAVPLFHMFSDFHSVSELHDRLEGLAGFRDNDRALDRVVSIWQDGAHDMFAQPEITSFREAEFSSAQRPRFTNLNIDVSRSVKSAGIFISYKREDQKWLDRLYGHLTVLEEKGFEVWKDWDINAGELWDDQIRLAIKKSRVAVLLVTPDFFKSKYIMEVELPLLEAASENGLKIFWIPIRKAEFEKTLLGKVHSALPLSAPLENLTDAEIDQSFSNILMKLGKVLGLDGLENVAKNKNP